MTKPLGTVTCTRGTTACTREIAMTLPTQVRKITWQSNWLNNEKYVLVKVCLANAILFKLGQLVHALKYSDQRGSIQIHFTMKYEY